MTDAVTRDDGAPDDEDDGMITMGEAMVYNFQASRVIHSVFSPVGLALVLAFIVLGNLLAALLLYVVASGLGAIGDALAPSNQWTFGVAVGLAAALLYDVLKRVGKALARRVSAASGD